MSFTIPIWLFYIFGGLIFLLILFFAGMGVFLLWQLKDLKIR